jgi:hypothetical protein
MLSFLDEVQALKAIRELIHAAATAKLAVAFWGSGAVASLGLDRSGLDVEAICNLDSGACNPTEIEKLRQLRPRTAVKSDPRLHGKVYWTPDAVVVGSSNASTNGLAIEIGLSGWAEANILCEQPGRVERGPQELGCELRKLKAIPKKTGGSEVPEPAADFLEPSGKHQTATASGRSRFCGLVRKIRI